MTPENITLRIRTPKMADTTPLGEPKNITLGFPKPKMTDMTLPGKTKNITLGFPMRKTPSAKCVASLHLVGSGSTGTLLQPDLPDEGLPSTEHACRHTWPTPVQPVSTAVEKADSGPPDPGICLDCHQPITAEGFQYRCPACLKARYDRLGREYPEKLTRWLQTHDQKEGRR
jgi:hypothetical protein